MRRQTIFFKDGMYHVFNRTIAKFAIFTYENTAERFLDLIDYCNDNADKPSFSRVKTFHRGTIIGRATEYKIIKIFAYCLMHNHYHLVLKQLTDVPVSEFVGRIENSLSKYVNKVVDRKGPLWESRFRSVQIKNEFQLKHAVRYAHLNPTTSSLVNNPKDWNYSSYKDYINCGISLKDVSELSFGNMRNFIRFHENQIDYQRSLKNIQKTLEP